MLNKDGNVKCFRKSLKKQTKEPKLKILKYKNTAVGYDCKQNPKYTKWAHGYNPHNNLEIYSITRHLHSHKVTKPQRSLLYHPATRSTANNTQMIRRTTGTRAQSKWVSKLGGFCRWQRRETAGARQRFLKSVQILLNVKIKSFLSFNFIFLSSPFTPSATNIFMNDLSSVLCLLSSPLCMMWHSIWPLKPAASRSPLLNYSHTWTSNIIFVSIRDAPPPPMSNQ